MQLPPMKSGYFIKRYKRFLVDIEDDQGQILTVYCPNTGSMKACAQPGWRVWYSHHPNGKRKYQHTLEYTQNDAGDIIGVNTQRPNQLVEEALRHHWLTPFDMVAYLKREVNVDSGSRMDFYYQRSNGQAGFIEVKNVTLLESDGQGYFPDASSLRGRQHLIALADLAQAGYEASLLFCVQHSGINYVSPADHIDGEYGRLLRQVSEKGVNVFAYRAVLTADQSLLNQSLQVVLSVANGHVVLNRRCIIKA